MSASPLSNNRREFLASTLAAIASVTIVAPEVLGGPGKIPPSDQFRFVQIGAGGKGASDLKSTINAGGIAVALCDVDVQRAGKMYENHPDLPRFTDYRQMLDELQTEYDGVVVSTPDHLHGVQALDAMRRGKHVYVQKPLARTYDECDRLLAAAKKYGVATQMGNQGHAGVGISVYQAMVQDSSFGKIHAAHCWSNRPIWPQGMTELPASTKPPVHLDWNLWLGPAADRPYAAEYAPFTWRGWWDFGCGAMGDMACHNMDPVFSALGLTLPSSIVSQASAAAGLAFPEWSIVNYDFAATQACPEGVKVTWYDGKKMPEVPVVPADEQRDDHGFQAGTNGCMIVGEKMTVAGGSHAAVPEVIAVASDDRDELYDLRQHWRKRVAELGAETRLNHYKQWIEAAKQAKPEMAGSRFEYSSAMSQSILLGCISLRYPLQPLTWNPAENKFAGIDEANEFLKMTPRDGYDLTV